jgi:hypothetical protein
VEFTFDMREDTADCIAKEMMDDLSLSEDEAAKIAKKIKEEISRLVSTCAHATLTLGLQSLSVDRTLTRNVMLRMCSVA